MRNKDKNLQEVMIDTILEKGQLSLQEIGQILFDMFPDTIPDFEEVYAILKEREFTIFSDESNIISPCRIQKEYFDYKFRKLSNLEKIIEEGATQNFEEKIREVGEIYLKINKEKIEYLFEDTLKMLQVKKY